MRFDTKGDTFLPKTSIAVKSLHDAWMLIIIRNVALNITLQSSVLTLTAPHAYEVY